MSYAGYRTQCESCISQSRTLLPIQAVFQNSLPVLKIYSVRHVNYRFSVFSGSEFWNAAPVSSLWTLREVGQTQISLIVDVAEARRGTTSPEVDETVARPGI